MLSISIWAFFENANWGVASALSIITSVITVVLMAAVMRAPLKSLSMGISVQSLVKRFGGSTIIDHVSFEIAHGELVSLLGPSGCGKTTTLRCIAGLETPEEGRIEIDDEVVFDSARGIMVEPYHRSIGMVFQSYAIWPHMSVFQNVAFPLHVRIARAPRWRRRVMRALEMVGLAGFRDRSSQQLSGGQQQRVAVARAIVHSPAALLFDEPLSNLDAKLRDHTRAEIRRLQRDLHVATVYVTHDQGEALSLSDRILVMGEGRIRQAGTPRGDLRAIRMTCSSPTSWALRISSTSRWMAAVWRPMPVARHSVSAFAPPGTGPVRAMVRPDRLRDRSRRWRDPRHEHVTRHGAAAAVHGRLLRIRCRNGGRPRRACCRRANLRKKPRWCCLSIRAIVFFCRGNSAWA